MKVLVVRLSALGDIVHTVPAVAAIAAALPRASIDWLVERRHRPVLDLFDTGAVAVEIDPSASWGSVGGVLSRLRASRYDVALDFQGLLKSAVLARLSGARRIVGFVRSALREPLASAMYTDHIDPGAAPHIIAKNLALAGAVGASATVMRFPFSDATNPSAQTPDRFAVLNPGAGWPNKQWAPERFGEVAAALRERQGLRCVVTWGPGEEPLADAVVRASAGAAEAAPATSLSALMALLRAAALVVSGDTGPIHLAAAAGTPVVGIYGPTDPRRNGPWSPFDQTVSRFETCVCHHKRRCHRASRCLDEIEAAEVIRAVSARLDQPDVISRRT